jgi:hypothetical protein
MRTCGLKLFITWSLAMGGGTTVGATEPWLLPAASLHDAPRVVGGIDRRLLLGPGDELEVRGPHTERLVLGERYRLVRWQAPQRSIDASPDPLWVQALGHARAVRTHASPAVAWLRIEDASDAVQLGDLVWWWPTEVQP